MSQERLKMKGIHSKSLKDTIMFYLKNKHPSFEFDLKFKRGWRGLIKVYYKNEEDVAKYLEKRLTQNSRPTLKYSFSEQINSIF